MIELRDYQQRLIGDTREAYAAGARAILSVMPTGAGKSATIAHMCARHEQRGGVVVTLTHTIELRKQAADALTVAGAKPNVRTIQSMLRGERPEATFVWIDEAERGLASEWAAVIAHYKAAGAIVIGTTATPCRADGRAMGDLFDAMVLGPSVGELTERGILVPCRVFAPPQRVRGVLDDPVRRYQELGDGGQAFVYCATVKHAEEMAAQFNGAGIGAAIIEGELDGEVRAATMDRFRRGELRVLTSVSCLDAGIDVPAASVCILATGCAHVRTYLQRIGRVLRASPGKTGAVIIDLVGSSLAHGLPTERREYSLQGDAIKKAPGLAPLSQCKRCGAVYGYRPQCPECGHRSPPPKLPKSVRGELSEIFGADSDEEKREYYERTLRIAQQTRRKPQWAAYKFKAKYGHWPPAARPPVHRAPIDIAERGRQLLAVLGEKK